MKKMITPVAVAAIILGGWFLCGCGSSFDISPETPLGSFDKLDKHLTESIKLKKKDTAKEIQVDELNTSVKVFDYVDEVMQDNSGFSQYIRLMQDSSGALVGLTGIFTTQGGSVKVENFLNDYWKTLAGAEPSFQAASSGRGIFQQNVEMAVFTQGEIKGTWAKQNPTETVLIIYNKK